MKSNQEESARAEDYVTADKEPLNVPVGYIYFSV